jgi:hypothetical protein
VDGGRAQLACAAAILLALGGVLALGAPEAAEPVAMPDATSNSTALSPAEVQRISVAALPAIARGVERIRELEFDRLPEPEVVTAEYLNRLGERQLEREPGGLGVAADNAFGAITGLLEADEDIGALAGSTGDLAAAAYDPRSERLFVVADASAGNRAMVEFVLSHELDHALEDQAFGLPEGRGLDDDGALAAQALIEGSATAVMGAYADDHLDPFELLAAAGTIDDGADAVPDAIVEQLTWTYFGGQEFVTELVDLAGSWKLVDNALENRLPASTEQVLHPRKYVLDERPSPVRVHGAALRERGWQHADRQVLGEYGTSLMLGVGVDDATAADAAAGWDGDAYELWKRDGPLGACDYPCRDELALVMSWRWDSAREREDFDAAVATYVEDGLGGTIAGDATWTVEGGAVALAAAGERSALVFAPDAETARAAAKSELRAGT